MSDCIDNFLNERVFIAPDMKVHNSQLYRAYKMFCHKNAVTPVTAYDFRKFLKDEGFRTIPAKNCRSLLYVCGIFPIELKAKYESGFYESQKRMRANGETSRQMPH